MEKIHEYVRKVDSYEKVKNGVFFHCLTNQNNRVEIVLTICNPYIFRFQMLPSQKFKDIHCLLEIKEDWTHCVFDISEDNERIIIDTGVLYFNVQKNPWEYTIYDKAKQPVLCEYINDRDAHNNYRSLPLGFVTDGDTFYSSNENFKLKNYEYFYGFGEKFTQLNKRGQRIHGWNTNPYGSGTEEAHKNIPFFMSTRGYGIFINSTYRITYDIGNKSLMSFSITIDHPKLDLFFIYGPDLKLLLSRYVEITGKPSFPPKGSFGTWCNIEEVTSIDEIVTIGKKFRDLDIPIDMFSFIPFFCLAVRPGMSQKEILSWTKKVSQKFDDIMIKLGLYVLPLLNLGSEMEKEAREQGFCLQNEDGSPYELPLGLKTEGERGESEYSLAVLTRDEAWRQRHNHIFYTPCLMPDFTNPDTVKWWKHKITEIIKAGCYGIAMSDFGEDVPTDACYHNGRSGNEMHNLYTLLYQKASFEAVEENSDHRGIINARSGTAGMQKYPICWSGDPNCEWEDMATNIRSGLSIGLSGVPFWSCDAGGYSAFTGHLTPELWMRWTQWSMFLSHVRLHGTLPLRVPWTFGERATENFRYYSKLRYRLIPYIYSQAYQSTQTGLPMMRAMVLEFQDDPNVYNLEDQYLFGDSFLVAPICTSNNERTVYLPTGFWFDYYSKKKYEGPLTLRIKPSLEIIPLYVKGDSIIPMGPDISYIEDKPFDKIILDVFLIDRAECIIYDDDEIVLCQGKRENDKVILLLSATSKKYVVKFNKIGYPNRLTLNGVDITRYSSKVEWEKEDYGWYFNNNFTLFVNFTSMGSQCKLIVSV